MNSRKEKTAKLNAKRKKAVITVAAGVATVITALFFIPSASSRDITEIEKRIPSSAGMIFISDPNVESWKYFNALAGTITPMPESVEKIGFSSINESPTLYFSTQDENVETTEDFLNANSISYVKKDGVYAITTDDNRLADDGIGNSSEYQQYSVKGGNASFGYVNFKNLDAEELPSEMEYLLPSAGSWFGEFKAGQWDGKITSIDYSNIDVSKADREILENIHLGYFMDQIETVKNSQTIKGTFHLGEINSLLENDYQSAIQLVKFEINGERLTFTLN